MSKVISEVKQVEKSFLMAQTNTTQSLSPNVWYDVNFQTTPINDGNYITHGSPDTFTINKTGIFEFMYDLVISNTDSVNYLTQSYIYLNDITTTVYAWRWVKMADDSASFTSWGGSAKIKITSAPTTVKLRIRGNHPTSSRNTGFNSTDRVNRMTIHDVS